MAETTFPCEQCGAELKFAPGMTQLHCEYCGHTTEIPEDEDFEIEELDFHAYLAQAEADAEGSGDMVEADALNCDSCGASITLEEGVHADECPFCGSTIVATATHSKFIKPASLLPFKVTSAEAKKAFDRWLKSLWFAPNKLKKRSGGTSPMSGVYLPYWTYDAETTSHYSGQRGEHYYVNEDYTDSDGKRRTRRVRKTRWHWVRGVVHLSFDDLLVLASHSLPTKYVEELEPWDLGELVPYSDEYLSGFRSEVYQVDLAEGFEEARGKMEEPIRNAIRRDIGGDQQRIHKVQTQYADITFKHLLLPVWVSAYRYNEQVYRFLVNARTGEVQGERPWSAWKIAAAVAVVLAVLAVIIFLIVRGQGG